MEFVNDQEATYDHLVNSLLTLEIFAQPFKAYYLREDDPLIDKVSKIARCTAHYIFKNDATIVPALLGIYQNITERKPEEVGLILMKQGALARITIQCLEVQNPKILVPSIRTIANCLSTDNEFVTVGLVRDLQLLTKVKNLIIKYDTEQQIKGDLLFLTSNVPIKNRDVLDIFTDQLLELVIANMGAPSFRVRFEAATALSVFLKRSSSSLRYIRRAVELRALEGIRAQMNFKDQRMLIVILQCLDLILAAGEKEISEGNSSINQYWLEFLEITGEAKLMDLLEHNVETVYKEASRILHTYKGSELIHHEPIGELIEI